MRKETPITLHVPTPCNQDWNSMPIKDSGRYCSRCTQIVHDFSQMPDQELLQYFKTRTGTTCGRFHKHQLDRAIQPQEKRWHLPAYVRKIAASILAALSFRTAIAQGTVRSKASVVMQPAATPEKNLLPENVVISGKLIKGNEEPVANAKVSVDTLITVFTDAEGKFSIPLSGDLITSHNLYFSYDGLERTVRTFHPLMGSTNYDVRLSSKEDYTYYGYVAGGISFGHCDFPSIKFSNRQLSLSRDAKALLSVIAEKLKDNPSVMIQLVAFGKSINDTKNAKRKLQLVRDFLIKNLNINKELIFDKIEKEGSNDTIDVLQYLGE